MRKIGQRIIYVLQILEREGQSSCSEISIMINFLDKDHVHTYLRRAVKYELATVKKINTINVYTVKNGWRDSELIRQPKKLIKPIKKAERPLINSVWALGLG